MAHVVPLSRKGAFRRAAAQEAPGEPGQLSLFAARPATVVRLHTGLGAFEEALLLDRRGSEGAAPAYRRAVDTGDRAADACCNLGILAATAGRGEEALEWFADALSREPAHAEAHYNLGCLYLDLAMYGPARVHLGIAAAGDPSEPELQFNLAIALSGIGRVRDAADALRRYRDLVSGEEDDGADRLLEQLERVLQERA